MMREPQQAIARLRRDMVAILASILTALVLLAALVLMPLRGERRAVEAEKAATLAEMRLLRGAAREPPLGERMAVAAARNRELKAEWERLRRHVDTFQEAPAMLQSLSALEDGRIDFKVALFEARARLNTMAEERHVALPQDIGILETIGSDERAELRLWEVFGTVRLIELAVEAGVKEIVALQSLPPVDLATIKAGHGRENGRERERGIELPVSVTFRAGYSTLMTFLSAIGRPGRFFTVRWVRVERDDVFDDDALAVHLVLGSVLFRSPGDVLLPDGIEVPVEDAPDPDAPTPRRRPVAVGVAADIPADVEGA